MSSQQELLAQSACEHLSAWNRSVLYGLLAVSAAIASSLVGKPIILVRGVELDGGLVAIAFAAGFLVMNLASLVLLGRLASIVRSADAHDYTNVAERLMLEKALVNPFANFSRLPSDSHSSWGLALLILTWWLAVAGVLISSTGILQGLIFSIAATLYYCVTLLIGMFCLWSVYEIDWYLGRMIRDKDLSVRELPRARPIEFLAIIFGIAVFASASLFYSRGLGLAAIYAPIMAGVGAFLCGTALLMSDWFRGVRNASGGRTLLKGVIYSVLVAAMTFGGLFIALDP